MCRLRIAECGLKKTSRCFSSIRNPKSAFRNRDKYISLENTMTSIAPSRRNHVSNKASRFTESVIREMTREALKHGAVNLSQGFPDFPAPEDIKSRAMQAIADAVNQYA